MAQPLHRAGWSGAATMLSRPPTGMIRVAPPAFLAPSYAPSHTLLLRGSIASQRRNRQQQRYASSSSSSSSSSSRPSVSVRSSASSIPEADRAASSSSSSSSSVARNDRLNPPISTLPPKLESVERGASQSAPSYWYAIGKAYLTFFKSGIKAVWNNSQLARGVRQRDRQASLSEPGTLTRAEWQLLRRSSRDTWRLPAFGLVLLVFGEFTVLLLPVVGGIVPRTCWVPQQVSHHRGGVEARRAKSFKRGDSVVDEAELALGRGGAKLQDLRLKQLVHAGRSLDLYSPWWDRLWDNPPRWLLLRRLGRWQSYVEKDDAAIVRCGGVRQLESDELKIAAEERGLDVLGRKDETLQKTLTQWIEQSEKQGVWNLVLTRPNAWDRKAGRQ